MIQLTRACAGQTFPSSRHRQVIASVDSSAPWGWHGHLPTAILSTWAFSGCHICHLLVAKRLPWLQASYPSRKEERKGEGHGYGTIRERR